MNEDEIRDIIYDYEILLLKMELDRLDFIAKLYKENIKKVEDNRLLFHERVPKLEDEIQKELFSNNMMFQDNLRFAYTEYLELEAMNAHKRIEILESALDKDFFENIAYTCKMYINQNKHIEAILKMIVDAKIEIILYKMSSLNNKKSEEYNKNIMEKKKNDIQDFLKFPIKLQIPKSKDKILQELIANIRILLYDLKEDKKIHIKSNFENFIKDIVTEISENKKLPKNHNKYTEEVVKKYLKRLNEDKKLN